MEKFDETNESVVLGEHAHVEPHSVKGPRGKGKQRNTGMETEKLIDDSGPASYANSILLCPNCHKIVDDAPARYSSENLHKMKNDHEKRLKAGYDLEIVVRTERRPVNFPSVAVSRDPNSFISRIRSDPFLAQQFHEPYEPNAPRVSGMGPGLPQVIIDVKVMNRGPAPVHLCQFKLSANESDIPLDRTNILNKPLGDVFAEPLEPRRAKQVELKAQHVAKFLRAHGVAEKVRLTFTFIDECEFTFSQDLAGFDPNLYPETPDGVSWQK